MKNLEKQLVAKYPMLGSSQSPESISLSLKAGAVAILPVLTLVLGAFGVEAEWLKDLVNSSVALISAGLVVYGIVRRFKK